MKRQYTKEFKIQALELATQLGSISGAAKQLGVSDSVIHAWRQKYGTAGSSKTVAESIGESEQVAQLKKKIADLEKSNYILSRAAAFFSRDLLK